MASFPLLDGLRVIEVAQLGPAALGGHLADFGAEVIKVDLPPHGDPLRQAEPAGVGGADGVGLLHLRWNRGKRSIRLDLTDPEDVAAFRELVAHADVLIEGMRPGMLARLGLGVGTLRAEHPRLIWCSISGFGNSGPYHQLGSHAPAYDAYAAHDLRSDGTVRESLHDGTKSHSIGVNAAALYAAAAILAAVVRQRATGEGCTLDIAAADCAALWLPDTVDRVLNADVLVPRPARKLSDGRMPDWPRLDYYRARDGSVLLLQVLEPKFWRRFCEAVARSDLLAFDGEPAALREELAEVIATRDRAEWMELFIEEGIPAAPANTAAELARDPQLHARELIYDGVCVGTPVRLTGSPVKLAGHVFQPAPPPALDADRAEILNAARINKLQNM